MSTLPIIGWSEWISLPDLGIENIKAKVDTGARSSALHTFSYELYEVYGINRVKFIIHPLKKSKLELTCDFPVETLKNVKDSGGHVELRPFIKTKIKVGDSIIEDIELNLTNRENMNFRMLLGRTAINKNFIVDVSK